VITAEREDESVPSLAVNLTVYVPPCDRPGVHEKTPRDRPFVETPGVKDAPTGSEETASCGAPPSSDATNRKATALPADTVLFGMYWITGAWLTLDVSTKVSV